MKLVYRTFILGISEPIVQEQWPVTKEWADSEARRHTNEVMESGLRVREENPQAGYVRVKLYPPWQIQYITYYLEEESPEKESKARGSRMSSKGQSLVYAAQILESDFNNSYQVPGGDPEKANGFRYAIERLRMIASDRELRTLLENITYGQGRGEGSDD